MYSCLWYPRPPPLQTHSTNAGVSSRQGLVWAPGRAQSRPSTCLLSKPPRTPPAPRARAPSSRPPQWPLGARGIPPTPLPLPRALGKARPAWGRGWGWRVMDEPAQGEELGVRGSHPTSCPPPGPLPGCTVGREQVSPAADQQQEHRTPLQHPSCPTHRVASGNTLPHCGPQSPCLGAGARTDDVSLFRVRAPVPCVGSPISHPTNTHRGP